MPQKGTEEIRLALERPPVAAGRRRELVENVEGQIRQRVELQVAPDVLHRIEFGRVGRKELGRDLPVRGEEVLDEIRAMGIEPVPDENDGRVNLCQELPEKVDDTLGVDVVQSCRVRRISLLRGRFGLRTRSTP